MNQSGVVMNLQYRAAESFWENGLIFNSQGKPGAKKVKRNDVRPNPPAIVQRRCRWIIGDVTEVLDRNTWKLGKIAKMLKDNYFVIRLANCIQLKQFHISSLRVPLLRATPAPFNPAPEKAANLKRRKSTPRHQLQTPPPTDTDDLLLRRTPCKKRRIAASESHHQPTPQTTRMQFREEADECCSVASCSINDAQRHQRPARRASCCFPDDEDDAASACPCTSGRREQHDDDVVLSEEEPAGRARDVHELELEAYECTMRALYASGPLTWEQESLLTNLRMSLNISNEEHLLQLRHLLST